LPLTAIFCRMVLFRKYQKKHWNWLVVIFLCSTLIFIVYTGRVLRVLTQYGVRHQIFYPIDSPQVTSISFLTLRPLRSSSSTEIPDAMVVQCRPLSQALDFAGQSYT
jgi:hypothetical protein